MNKLLKYYKDNHELNIFFKRNKNDNFNYGIMYIYIYDDEIEKYKNTFGSYFPFYVMNEDQLLFLNPDLPDFESKLKNTSLKNWKRSSIIPQRKVKVAGIYGELFLDYYLRVVLGLDPLISYASKRSYKSNYESTGIDNVMVDENGKIELYLSEAKFVYGKSAAKSDLLKDIKGSSTSDSHLTKEYINSYMDFVIYKASESNQVKNLLVKAFINKANTSYLNDVTFLDLCIKEDIKLKVILFATQKIMMKILYLSYGVCSNMQLQ